MDKLIIVQPHSDDALFSCSHMLLYPDRYEIKAVVTVENDPKRVKEDRELYRFLGIPYHNLEVNIKDESYYGFHKQYKTLDVWNCEEYLREYFGAEQYSQIKETVWRGMSRIRDFSCRIVSPLGIGHPFHLFVRGILQYSNCGMWYYRDFPHSYKRRSKEQLQKTMESFQLERSVPVDDFADVKWELARRFYKSQKSLLYFEQQHIAKNYPEEVYTLNEDEDLPF